MALLRLWGVVVLRFVVTGMCTSVCGVAFAAVPTVSGWSLDGGQTVFASKQAACVDYTAKRGVAVGRSDLVPTLYGAGDVQCKAMVPNSTNDFGTATFSQSNGACPSNSTKSGSACQCNSGYVENSSHTACEVPPNDCQLAAGQPDGIWRYDGGYGVDPNPLSSELCKSGSGRRCIVKVTDPKCTQVRLQGVGNPYWVCRGTAYYTGGWGMGAACDRSVAANGDGGATPTLPPVSVDPPPDQLPPNTAAPTDCPPGTFEGTVNGAHVCAEDVSNPGTTKSPETGKEEKKNPDGSTITTTTDGTTKCINGSCTTTNNTTTNITGNPNSTCPQGTTPSGPNGSPSSCTGTSSSSSTRPQTQFCQENKGSAQCKDGESAFSGSCAGGFICKGDAIQCAMAQEQHRARCDYEKWDAPWKQNGIKDIQASGDISKEFYVNDGSNGNSAWTSWLGSTSVTASCPAGFPMQLLGEQYTLSLQPLCDVGEGARPIVIAVALLLALRTFLSVVTRD